MDATAFSTERLADGRLSVMLDGREFTTVRGNDRAAALACADHALSLLPRRLLDEVQDVAEGMGIELEDVGETPDFRDTFAEDLCRLWAREAAPGMRR